MKKEIKYMETGSINPYYNLAFEEYILRNRTNGDYVILWQNDNTIVVGQNQNTEAEINRQFVEEHQVNVVRRMTGGGAVYHDLGNLNYSFITDVDRNEETTPQKFMGPIIQALKKMGLDCCASGRNDILIQDCKISGTAQRVIGNRILHHGTLLFDSDLEMLTKVLKADPEKFKSKGIKSVRSRVANIRSFFEEDITMEEFWANLKRSLLENDFIEEVLDFEELKKIEELKKEKYDTWEWNFGYSPKYSMKNKKRWTGGTLEVQMSVKEGKIEEMVFYGDYLAIQSVKDIADALKGCMFKEADVRNVLQGFRIQEYFGSITIEEILNTIFL